jgi:uncharacterized protein (DUF2147 family)
MLQRPRNTISKTIYCGFFLSSALVAPALAADPTGDWKVADGVANIRVAECYGSMWGAVAWEKTPGGRDQHNPDPAKQSRPTLGMPILIDMKKNATNDQWKGQVYNAKDGQLYESTIKLAGPDQLEIQGCVLGFLCGGETWTRVSGPIPSSPANSMAKGAPKGGVAAGTKNVMSGAAVATNPAAPKSAAPAPPKAAPTTAQAPRPPGAPGQKSAAADPVGDICLLPDIARLPH